MDSWCTGLYSNWDRARSTCGTGVSLLKGFSPLQAKNKSSVAERLWRLHGLVGIVVTCGQGGPLATASQAAAISWLILWIHCFGDCKARHFYSALTEEEGLIYTESCFRPPGHCDFPGTPALEVRKIITQSV